MSSGPSHRRVFRFRIVDLLLLLAGVAVSISLYISAKRLSATRYAQRGLRSELRIVDGVPDAVGIRCYWLDDGTVLTRSQVTLLKVAVVVQVTALAAVAVWVYRRFRLWARLSIRSVVLSILGMVLLYIQYASVPLDSPVVSSIAYFLAWLVPGASLGYDLGRSRDGIAIGALIGALLGGLLLLWLMQPVARE